MLRISVFHGESDGDRDGIDDGFDDFWADDVAGFEVVGFDDFVDGVGLDGFSHVVGAVLPFSLAIGPLIAAVAALPHLILGDFRSLLPPALTACTVLLEIFKHDVLVADQAGLGSSAAGFQVFGVFGLWPGILAVFAVSGFSGTEFVVGWEELRFDHLLAHGAFLFFVELFLGERDGTSCCY